MTGIITRLASFTELRQFADSNPIARIAIDLRKNQIRALSWDIVPSEAAGRASSRSRLIMRSLDRRREDAIRLFRHPDPDFFSFGSWISAVMEQVFVTDSLVVYCRGNKQLSLVEGSSIEPVTDHYGRCAGYRQHLHEIPRLSYMERPESLGCCEGGFTGSSLMYCPRVRRSWTPFGFSPIEEALSEKAGASEPGSDDRILEAFALDGRSLGFTDVYSISQEASDAWLQSYLDWTAEIFNTILGGNGLRWKWQSE